MKKITVIIVSSLMLTNLITAQHQLENPGFETWDDVLVGGGDTIREPVDWSSLKTSDNSSMSSMAPVVCQRSTDAHTGKYSIRLTNVQSFFVVNGAATNGRVHPNINTSLAYMFTDTQSGAWNTPFTSRPDSVTGWFKYAPQANDTLQFKIALHRDFGKMPDADFRSNWVGMAVFKSPVNTGTAWKRFSVPFTYFSNESPEYILVVLNSGNGFLPVAGSMVNFDDIEMIYNSPLKTLEYKEDSNRYLYALGNQYLVIQGINTSYQRAEIRDITGRLLWASGITTDRVDISSANLGNGIYLVTLTCKSEVYTQKIWLH